MSALGTSIDRVRAELAANPRLRAGVWAIIAILLGYWVFVPHAARVDEAAIAYAAVDARLVRARELLAREDWQQRLDAAAATETRLAERFWHAANEGLAQAEVRTALEDMARGVAIQPRIDVGLSKPVPGVPDLWQVQVQITGTASLESALRLVYAIARHPQVLVAERFVFNRVRRNEVNMDALLSAYFKLGNPDPAQPATAAASPLRPDHAPVGDALVPSRRALRARFENAGAFSAQHNPRPAMPRHGSPQGARQRTVMELTNA